jgi:hypothetical protein
VDDLRRTLSQVFGDGQGGYPPDAYLDLFQIHNLMQFEEVDALYEGLDKPDPKAERIGAFAALVDFRDGTNRTGLNPREERLIRHIGITGHLSSPTLMECIQRDGHSRARGRQALDPDLHAHLLHCQSADSGRFCSEPTPRRRGGTAMTPSPRPATTPPLPKDHGRVFYFRVYDGGFRTSHNTAWIYKGTLK